MSDDNRLHRIQRKLIMKYLLLAGFAPVAPERLLYHLRDLRYACTLVTLNFHLNYLRQKAWIEVEMKPQEIGEKPEMLSVKITASGVDALDAGEFDKAIAAA